MFDIGDRVLFAKCWGEAVVGEPTVLLIGGLGADTSSWEPFASDFADDGHHVCAYDRAGVGASGGPAESSRTTTDQVADLLALLDEADIPEPLLVVAHSLGSLPAIAFVAHETERVAGVVLLDPWSPRVPEVQQAALPPAQPDESPALREARSFVDGFVLDPSQNPERLLLSACDDEVTALLDQPGPLFGDLPVVVLHVPAEAPPGLPETVAAATSAAIEDGRREFADESIRGTFIEVENSGHSIHWDQPNVVMDAIRDVISG